MYTAIQKNECPGHAHGSASPLAASPYPMGGSYMYPTPLATFSFAMGSPSSGYAPASPRAYPAVSSPRVPPVLRSVSSPRSPAHYGYGYGYGLGPSFPSPTASPTAFCASPTAARHSSSRPSPSAPVTIPHSGADVIVELPTAAVTTDPETKADTGTDTDAETDTDATPTS
ncbi:uncharacterized protein AMSG_05821 [Thecamonas trahens ATCC 50062]|uniref:Uncharacterized protein n=1 Tax=Thecamonas trahens ATCC 50062 TaxID=461836 RepID=A0A0L0DFG6_THETB|nr:hypothetical protein AMSG_05821 [Thecamonas trahens ATCC 50062]KNC50058.1 hypothetical protein AMSG_05821 [Thecamonas trahens ATCC 50062]|eukprot:XP_013757223.1 hypothetical protein AMSG_05821 [Thecamonas trahens ATCC 50062]